MHGYSEVSLTDFNRTYSYVHMYKITAYVELIKRQFVKIQSSSKASCKMRKLRRAERSRHLKVLKQLKHYTSNISIPFFSLHKMMTFSSIVQKTQLNLKINFKRSKLLSGRWHFWIYKLYIYGRGHPCAYMEKRVTFQFCTSWRSTATCSKRLNTCSKTSKLLPSYMLFCTHAYILWLWIQNDTLHLISRKIWREEGREGINSIS